MGSNPNISKELPFDMRIALKQNAMYIWSVETTPPTESTLKSRTRWQTSCHNQIANLNKTSDSECSWKPLQHRLKTCVCELSAVVCPIFFTIRHVYIVHVLQSCGGVYASLRKITDIRFYLHFLETSFIVSVHSSRSVGVWCETNTIDLLCETCL